MDDHALRQHAVLAFGRRTNAQPPLAVLMQDAATVVGEVLHAQYGGAGEVHGDALVLSIHALGGDCVSAKPREHRCPMNDAASMAAFALRSGSATLCEDVGKETRFRDMFLRGLGVATALTVPLHVNGKPFGVLAAYCRQRREFSLEDVAFAETISHLLSASAARIKAEQKLEEAHALKSSLLGMVDSMVMTLDMDGRVVDMNRACEELTQYGKAEMQDRPFWQSMVAADDAELIKLIFQSSRDSQIPSEFEGELIAHDGTEKKVSWSLKVLSTGQVQSVLVTGRDQTVHAEIKTELERVRALASETTATLNQLSARLEKRAPTRPPAPPPPPIDNGVPTPPTEAEMAAVTNADPLRGCAAESDQRRSPRRAYRYRQSIAATMGDRFPPSNAFFEVECWDISACGFSFFMDQLPKFETLLAALGRPPALCHFSARVMRVARMVQDGKTRYLVGCDFTERVQYPKAKA